jgi:chemotaxis methyl-accepting protein methylase
MPADLETYATERLGLHLSDERLGELQRFVETRGKAAAGSTTGGVEDFLNGETYFFRYPFFLSLLEGRLKAAGSQPFRVLCPACSTGEEVYSLAFVLGQAARRLGLRLEIVGTDVRPQAVRQAREGLYSVWSLRNTPPLERAKYFEVLPEGRFRVKDEFRSFVRFGVRNLLDPVDDGPFDAVVLCNATLYMHESAAREAYANVGACLQPDGVLLIAPTDPPPGALAWRHCPEYGGWSVYRKALRDAVAPTERVSNRLAELVLPAFTPLAETPMPVDVTRSGAGRGARGTTRRRSRGRAPIPPAKRPRPVDPGSPSTGGPHLSLWSLQPDAVELWAAWSAGKLTSVEPKIRQKVFFEPHNPLWRFLQGAVLWEQGWLARARREIERAKRLLAAAPAEAAMSGLCSAAELRRVIEEWGVQHG